VVPDVFGAELSANGANIWLNYDALAAGQFPKLKDADIHAGKPLDIYQPLITRLALTHYVTAFGYDWRNSISASAAVLAEKIQPDGKFPIHLIGHGMGGLVVWEFARSNKDLWAKLKAKGSKLVMLGAPLKGSWQIARLLSGRAALVKMLALLGRHTEAEIVALLQSFQGLLDMLPTHCSMRKGGRRRNCRGQTQPVSRQAGSGADNWQIRMTTSTACST
jgi:pimeloyl-ACP methyl ester carboxylesterase